MAYLKADRGGRQALQHALKAEDPDRAAALTHILSLDTPIADLVPLHCVAMQLALLQLAPRRTVEKDLFEEAVLDQLAGSDAQRLAPQKNARAKVLECLPGPWFCAALLATITSTPASDWVKIHGDPGITESRATKGGQALHAAMTDLCLPEALAQFRADAGLQIITALRLTRADTGPRVRIDWAFRFGFDPKTPAAQVIQTPDAVFRWPI